MDFTTIRDIAFIFAGLMLFKYYIYMIIAPFYRFLERVRRNRALKKYPHVMPPKISVIVPAWNEEVGILKTIESILANNYPHKEIIVISDGSTDKTNQIVREYIKQHQGQWIDENTVRFFRKKNTGKGPTLNYGISKATGSVVLTVDADSALDPFALENLSEYFRDYEVKAVVGNVKVSENFTLVGILQRLEYMFGFYFKRVHSVMGSEYIFGGACAAFRKEIFEKLGGFDEDNKTEDIEMSMRIRSHGLKAIYAENVVCYTEGASTIVGLINQRLRWKKGRIDTFLRYRRLFFSSDKRHNKFLSWIVLPFALLSELQLLLEASAISLLVTYSIVTGDFTSMAIGMLFLFMLYVVAAFFMDEGLRIESILLFPVTWFLFYMLVWIEYLAFIKSVHMVLRGEEIVWQNWNRQGISDLNT